MAGRTSGDYDYAEVIETLGVRVPFIPEIVTPKIEKPLRNDRYESGEAKLLRAALRPGDRVLDIGAGIGLVATIAAKVDGVGAVTSIEANPKLLPVIAETFRLNGVTTATVRHGAVAAGDGETTMPFYLRADFWASSSEPDSRPYVSRIDVPLLSLDDLVAEVRPTVLSCDIEGAELGLFDKVDLSGIRHIIIELHPKVYGADGVEAIEGLLASKGFHPSPENVAGSSVKAFTMRPETPSRFAGRKAAPWQPDRLKPLIVTCMKDEGPFILEWIAWHMAAGIHDFVVFSNDCTDGTDRLLDRLDDLGVIAHLPNPALATRSTFFQPAALEYLHHLKIMNAADLCISMDVDEFINVRIGDGTLPDLFRATGQFDVLSMSELNHGSNGVEVFSPGFVTDLFPRHETERPGPRKAQRGVKSIVRLSDRIAAIRNHRPDLSDRAARWLDGSGREAKGLATDPKLNGMDTRGTYDLVSLEHYALRSLDSYLVKMFRGDVVVKDKRVSQRYWRLRNRNEILPETRMRNQLAARAQFNALMQDPALAALHQSSCRAHAARVAELRKLPEFRERLDWIRQNAWEVPEAEGG